MNKTILIFSGYNQRAIVAFLRTIIKLNLDFAIIARDESDPIFNTEYKDKIILTRNTPKLELEYFEYLLKKFEKKHKSKLYLIIPTTEALNRFLLENKTNFENLNCEIPLVNKELYKLISDKYTFRKLCFEKGIKVPDEIKIKSKIKFPIVAKPIKYYSKNYSALYPVLIFNTKEWKIFESRYDKSDFYFEKYIEGESYYLLYYIHRNGTIYKFSQKNLVQQSDGKSIIAATSAFEHLTNDSSQYENLLKELNFYGLIMIEIRKDKFNNNFMIEANPRLWGPSQLFVDANYNFFYAFLNDFYCGQIELPSYTHCSNIKYFWFGGIIESYRQNKNLTFYSNYNEVELLTHLNEWLEYDIYKRKDTYKIFKKEISYIYER